ncbi:MAG: ATP-dependent DNA ligase [Acidobacteriaceae bacterium]
MSLMQAFAKLCEQIVATSKKTEKTRLIADYLRTHDPDTSAVACAFLSGRPFPAFEEATLNIGGALIWRAIANLADLSENAVGTAYRRTGDTGSAAEIVLATHKAEGTPLSVLDVEDAFRRISLLRGTEPKVAALEALLRRATSLEVKYILKIITSELRIGSKESLVEDAIAIAFDGSSAKVRRANMLVGDIGAVLRLAVTHTLDTARMRLFHPIGFMLASPAESSAEAFAYIAEAAVEDKYDGIRCQAHCVSGEVRLFSRTLDQITESFPEVVAALARIPGDVILDGEILAWDSTAVAEDPVAAAEPQHGSIARFHSHQRGRALPFSALQKRLGRKRVTATMQRDTPVAFVVFDVLFSAGALMIDAPLLERLSTLDTIFARLTQSPLASSAAPDGMLVAADPMVAPVLRAPVTHAASAQELDEIFDAARARGNEGLMIKDLSSAYVPGRRGKSWLKLKRTLATLDVVVTGAEWGNGRKSQWLSDYTFAVRDTANDRLVNVGKAYSGVTDEEIQQLTAHFKETVLVDNGHFRTVQPDTVFEVAFNNIQRSDRHESGYALRFPRIVRIRTDKLPQDVDTLDRVREIYESEISAGRAK